MGVLGNLGYNATSSPDFGSYGTPNAGFSSTGVLSSLASGAGLGASIGSVVPGIGTIAGAGVGALGGILSSLIGKKSQDSTNKAQMKLAEYEWQKNLEMWNLSNEYNSPIRQLERLRAAGLNPNLVYGGNSVGNSSSEAPKYNAPQLKAYTDFSGVGNAASTALNVALAQRDLDMKDQQKRLLSNQADAMQIDSLNRVAQTIDNFWRGSKSKFDYELASDLRKNSLEVANLTLQDMRENIRYKQNNNEVVRATADKIWNESRLTDQQRENLSVATAILNEDLDIKKFTNTMIKNGINPKSSLGERLLSGILGSLFGDNYVKFMDQKLDNVTLFLDLSNLDLEGVILLVLVIFLVFVLPVSLIIFILKRLFRK